MGDHNHMVGGHPSSHEPIGGCAPRSSSRSSSGHRGIPGDPNVTRRKFPAKSRVVKSGSEDEDELRIQGRICLPGIQPDFPPIMNRFFHLLNQHQWVLQAILVISQGLVRVTKGGVILKGVLT